MPQHCQIFTFSFLHASTNHKPVGKQNKTKTKRISTSQFAKNIFDKQLSQTVQITTGSALPKHEGGNYSKSQIFLLTRIRDTHKKEDTRKKVLSHAEFMESSMYFQSTGARM